ncbi:MAG: hypothetical protein HQ513_04665, partial [Rhodospirillales bacterium]|nr:hypothetical protein [Rhodospirillales bacterium]
YLLFHVLAELFAIIIGVLMFVTAWQTFPFSRNNFLMFLACGYVWLGGMDLVHTLTFPGMNILPTGGHNTTSQLWIAARFSECLLLVSAPFFLVRPVERLFSFFLFGVIATLLCTLVLIGAFPDPQTVDVIGRHLQKGNRIDRMTPGTEIRPNVRAVPNRGQPN